MNIVKITVLFCLLTVLLVWAGGMAAGTSGMLIAFCFALIMNFVSYWYSDKIVLNMYRASKINPQDYPKFYGIVKKLSAEAGLPVPQLYLVPVKTPNAFATGRNPQHSAVAVTQGILDILDDNELEAVLAHEISHVKNRDILIGSAAAAIAGAVFFLANMARFNAMFGRRRDSNLLGLLAMAILAPLAAMIIQLAISRSGEFRADRAGALLSKKPLFLASALRKLHAMSAEKNPLSANPATAHMFIVNPLSAKGISGLFSTHPNIEQRIERLQKIAREL